MCRLKRRWMKKLKLTYSSQLRRLWITLLLLFFLCIIFQFVDKFQYASKCRCGFKKKQLDLQDNRTNDNSLQDQRNAISAHHLFSKSGQESTLQNREKQLVPRPSSAEKIKHVMKLSKAFNKTKFLRASLDSEEEFSLKHVVDGTEGPWILHATNRHKVLKHSTKKGLVRNQETPTITFSDHRKPVAITKAGIYLVKVTESAAWLAAYDQGSRVKEPWHSETKTLPSPTHKRSSSSEGTKAQTFDVLEDKIPTEFASAKMDGRPPLSEKVALPHIGRTVGANISGLSQGATCKPKTHIVFLKVHKSASSTVMNILFRFGETHNLTFALPTNGASQLYYPYYFTAAAVEGFSNPRSKKSQFNIMCHHMRFFQPEVARVMPNSTFYFSILRNPVHLMESSFTYYKGTSSFNKAKNMEEFLNQTSRFYNASATDSSYAKNLMTFDFGYNHNGNFSAKQVQLMLRAIETEFDLLLISEYFDESMVLLKKVLCWDLDDVVSFPLNSRHNSTKTRLSESTIEKIKVWNKLDWEIYVHFNRTFWKKIDWHIGREHMQQEVRALRQKREQLARICLQGGGSVAPRMIRDQALAPLQYGSAKILGYNLKSGLDKSTRQMCQRLVTPELQYSRLLYRKQFPKKTLKYSDPSHLPKLYNRRTV